jgi:hypothetical protein
MIKNKKITLDIEVIQGKGNIVSNMGEEKVMFSINNGRYYNLGEIGGDIWDLLKGSIEVNSIVRTLMSNYQVEKKDCEEQVISFLDHLFEEGLIDIVK